MNSWGLHWFRRDLRIAGNPALEWNRERNSGRVLGVLFLDPRILAREDFSTDRFAFYLRTAQALRESLRKKGGDLLVLEGDPAQKNGGPFERLFLDLARAGVARPVCVSFNRDYEPYARKRDAAVSALLKSEFSVPVHTERDHLVLEPGEVLKPGGGIYSIYTPFAKRWFERFRSSEVQARLARQNDVERGRCRFSLSWEKLLGRREVREDPLDRFLKETLARSSVPIPAAGEKAAGRALEVFREKLPDYAKTRDFPALCGTSRLSHFLKNGSISVAQVIAGLGLERGTFKGATGASVFLNELVWREFYFHVLWHFPEVEKEAFREQYRTIRWENDERLFRAWQEGRTGFPIVDAGMRELLETGFMHNRVRMIVASFLTKDLLIDWRRGERHFMRRLLDGDLAANNGGWQWAASTGCDPQPYFRIFNPELQSRRFDPKGEYLRKFLPELRELGDRDIHAPRRAVPGYPAPIVDRKLRRLKTLLLYRR